MLWIVYELDWAVVFRNHVGVWFRHTYFYNTQRPKLSDPAHSSRRSAAAKADGTQRLQPRRSRRVRCHDGLKRSLLMATLMLMKKTYILKPTMTLNTLTNPVGARK